MCPDRIRAKHRTERQTTLATAPSPRSSGAGRAADAIDVTSPRSLIRRPTALTIVLTTLAATDLAYRLLLRAPLRRALGVGD
jgi:hypothetical protein